MAASSEPVTLSGRRQSATSPAATNVSPAGIAKPAVEPGARVVVARDDERGRRGGLDEHERGREPEAQRPHLQLTRSAR